MSNLYNNIEYMCQQNNINITQMCKTLNIPRSVLSELKSGRTKDLSSDNRKAISSFFNVDLEYLDHIFSEIPCPLCSWNYFPEIDGEIDQHLLNHNKWRKAVKHYGFCWSYVYRENVKARARNMLADENLNLSVQERVQCYENIYKALFSRAVESADYSTSDITFEDYIANLLWIKSSVCPDEHSEEYIILSQKYGVKKSIVRGTYFYTDLEPAIVQKKKAASKSITKEEQELMSCFRSVNDDGKKLILANARLVANSDEYKKSDKNEVVG